MSEIVLGIRLTADGKDLVGAVRVSTEEIEKMGGATKRAGGEAEKLNNQQKSLAESLSATASRIGAYTIGWNVAADAVMQAASAIKDYIKEAALLNARYETMGVVLEVVGRNAGYSRREMDLYVESVRKAGITMIASRESITKMVQANLDLSIASKLARAAQDAAVIGNINSSEAFTRLIYGIQSGQTEMLRTIGINVNFEESYKKLAKQLKVTTEQLTEQEKTQARANVVLEASTRITGTYEAAMGTAGKMLNSLARYTEDLKTMRGEVFNDALVIAVNAYTDALKDANQETRRLAENKKLQEWGRDLVFTFAWIGDTVAGAFDVIATAVEQTARGAMVALNGLRNAALMAFPGAGMMAKLLGSATGGDIDAYIESFGKKADENMAARVKRVQLRAAAEEYYEQKHLDETKRLLKAENDAYEEADLQRGADARRNAQSARPAGKSAAGTDPYPALLKNLEKKLSLEKESTEVERVQFELNELTDKQFAKMTDTRISWLLHKAREVDLKNQALAVDKAALELAQYQTERQEKANESLGAFNFTMGEHLRQIQVETEQYGASALQKETAIELRKLEAEYTKAQIGLNEYELKTLAANYEWRKKQLPEALARRDAARLAEDSAKKANEEQKRTNEEIQRGLTDAIYRGFEAGKGFARNFWTSMVNMAKTAVLRPVISFIVSPISGAITAAMSGMSLSGAANAASGGANLLSAGSMFAGLPSIGTALGNFGTAFSTFTTMVGEGASAMSAFSAAAAGMGPSLMAIAPWIAGAVAIGGALGLFGGDDRTATPQMAGLGSTSTINRSGFSGQQWVASGSSPTDLWAGSAWSDLASDQLAGFNKAITKVFSDAEAAAKQLGIDTSSLASLTVSMGATGNGVQADMQAALQRTADTVALSLMPNLADLQQSGETLAQTFGRLVAIQDQQNQLAFSMMDQQQQLAFQTKQLNDGFAALGIAVPASKDAFRELVQGLDITTLSGQNTLARLIQLGPTFAAVAEAATSAVADVGRSLQDIANERRGLQDQLDQLTMTSAQLLEKQREALDASNRSLFDHVQAAQAAKDATAAAAQAESDAAAKQAAIATERQGLQDQLDQLTLTSAQLLEKQREALDASNQALFDQVQAASAAAQAVKDASAAMQAQAAAAAAIASQRYGLETQLLQAQGDTAELRARELALLDESNRPLQEQIWAIQDKAAADALAAQAANQAAQAAQQAAAQQQAAADQLKNAWQSATASIVGEIERIRGLASPTPESLASAQAQFAIATAQSRAGDQEATRALPSLSRAILDMTLATAANSVDLQRMRGQVQGSLAITADLLARQYGLTLPGFALGTDSLPKDMALYAHKGERITPAPYNRSDATNAELLAALQALQREFADLRTEVELLRLSSDQTAVNTKEMADTVHGAMGNGPMLVETT